VRRVVLTALALSLSIGAAHAEPRLRNRASATILGGWGGAGSGGAARLHLSERLRWDAVATEGLRVDVGFAGRLGIGLQDGAHLDRVRIREARVRIRPGRFTILAGRDRPLPEFARLVDGVSLLVDTGRGVQLGGWLGEVPDAASTSPLPRFGGAAMAAWTHPKVRVAAMLEVLGAPGGFDRAALFLSGRLQIVRGTELGGRLEVEFGAADGVPARPVEAAVTVHSRLPGEVRVHGFYSLLGARAARRSPLLDPAGARLQARLVAAGLAAPTTPAAELVDLGPHHVAGGGIRWTPRLPESPVRLDFRFDGRARFHEEPKRSGGYLRLGGGARGFGRGRFGFRIDQIVVVRAEPTLGSVADTRFLVTAAPLERLSVELGARIGPRLDDPLAGPRGGVDFFVDLEVARGLTLSAGYELAIEPHDGGVGQVHSGLFTVSWALRSPRR